MAQTTDEDALADLLRALDSKRAEERGAAKRQVQALAPDALLVLSRLEARHFRRYRRNDRLMALLIVSVLYIPLFVYFWMSHAVSGTYLYAMSIMFILYAAPPFVLSSSKFKPSRARQGLAEVLKDVEDVHFVPVALTLLQYKTVDIMPVVLSLLKRLLPRLHSSDAQGWTTEQHQMLLALLADWKQEPEFRLYILKALEQIGDARAIPTVEALAAFDRDTPILIRQAASDCLPLLRERGEEQR